MDQQERKQDPERVYTKIERHALDHTVAQEKPRAILLGGQPGSGKSELARMAQHELSQNGRAVVIDADKLRERNPVYQALSITDPKNAADLTHKEAAEWARQRFEEQVAVRGVGRFVNQAQHDVAYKGLADSVSALESARAVDAIRVYDASQREIYANQLVRGSWQKEPGAQQALTEERVRTWTH